MAHQEAWGRTRFRHYYVGHIHTRRVVEPPGVVVEYLRTLAARDAYAAGAGYRSDRDLICDVWHRQWGLRSRQVVGIEEVMAA
jgi:hypothetical protein